MRKMLSTPLVRALVLLLFLTVCTDMFAGAGHTNYKMSAQELQNLVECHLLLCCLAEHVQHRHHLHQDSDR